MHDFLCADFLRMLVHGKGLCLILWCTDVGCMLVRGEGLCLILGVRILGVCLYMTKVYI